MQPVNPRSALIMFLVATLVWCSPDSIAAGSAGSLQGLASPRSESINLSASQSSRRVNSVVTGIRVAQEYRVGGTPRSPSPLDALPESSKRLTTRLRSFGVPFKIDANNGAFIEVQLYMSTDRGQTWTFHSRQTTDQAEFPFQADRDGEYWFALKTLNRDRQLLPSGDPQPELKIVVDTRKPELDFRIQTDPAGRVLCRWKATDKNLVAESMKIFYQPVRADGSLKPWLSVPITLQGQVRNGVYADQIGWWPETAEAVVNVAVEIQDAAGNGVRADRIVRLPRTAWRNRSVATARPAIDNAARSQPGRQVSARPAMEVPKQPDWARPNWKPPAANFNQVSSGQPAAAPLQPNTNPANQKSEVVANHSESDSGQHPEYVCENGICRPINEGQSLPNLDASFNRSRLFPGKLPLINPGRRPNRSASSRSRFSQLIGSPPEYFAPPVPPEIQQAEGQASEVQTAVNGNHELPNRLASSAHPTTLNPSSFDPATLPPTRTDSQVWQSDQDSWLPQNQRAVSSTTRSFDPSILPKGNETPATPTVFAPSNRPKTTFQGDQVVSESTTRGPRNQYRGGKRTAPPLSRPELLPGNVTAAKTALDASQALPRQSENGIAPANNTSGLPANSRSGWNLSQKNRRLEPTALPNSEPPRTSVDQDPLKSIPNTNLPGFREQAGTMRRLPGSPAKVANSSAQTRPFGNAGFQRQPSRESAEDTLRGRRSANRLSVGAISEFPNRKTSAPSSFVSTKRFRLPYGIDSIDPSGVGRVDLWMTTDDGQTWKNWGNDPDNVSPFPVQVESDGRYGFRIVVRSKDGLSGVGPASGADADLWVNVDTQSPLCRITSVPYGRGTESGHLVINYSASDNFLTLRPISLFYATNPDGPWNEIQRGLRNEGRFAWKVDRQIPEEIFLKIEAIDRASNVGRHLLSQRIDISGLFPRGTVHGVQPVGN